MAIRSRSMGDEGRGSRTSNDGQAEARADRGPDLELGWTDRVQRALMAWYRRGHRDLPWRRSPEPYRVLVSETMLVQTTVAAVIPYFERFLERFPTVQSLAEADEADVLRAWEGLGYYRRARQLQAAAQAIVRNHGGEVPADLPSLQALPGVGRYIAGAIRSFAFNRQAPIVEANTQRVLARWLAWDRDLKAPASQSRLWRAAERLVPAENAGSFNQAFMELGATVCTPRRPLCLACPVTEDCQARRQGRQDELPVRSARVTASEVSEACALVVKGDELLIGRRGQARLWEGFWEFPTIHVSGADPAGRSTGAGIDLAEGVLLLSGIVARIGPEVHGLRFGVTRYRITLKAHAAAFESGEPKAGPGLTELAWVSPEGLSDYPLGAASRRLARWAARNWDTLRDTAKEL
ncbi:A/G-specific adenine glycosylase [soil metagenome]